MSSERVEQRVDVLAGDGVLFLEAEVAVTRRLSLVAPARGHDGVAGFFVEPSVVPAVGRDAEALPSRAVLREARDGGLLGRKPPEAP